MTTLLHEEIHIRARMVRRFFYRVWKGFIINRVRKWIGTVQGEREGVSDVSGPAVVLCNLKRVQDLYVLMYLFREKEFSFVGLRSLEKVKVFRRLASFNRVVFFNPLKPKRSFFREILVTLRHFNRAIILFPKFDLDISKEFAIDPTAVVRIAMMVSVPIIPVSITWQSPNDSKCDVKVGKRLYISPASPEFRDVFFKRRGARKFSRLNSDELGTIAKRIFSRPELTDGSDIP